MKTLEIVDRLNAAFDSLQEIYRELAGSAYDDGAASPHVSASLLTEIDRLFDYPSRRLAVYGTLAPGEVNAHILQSVRGTWTAGWVCGELTTYAGYPYFQRSPLPLAQKIPCQMLTSVDLPAHFPRIDAFEGDAYVRRLIAVYVDNGYAIANIYEGKHGDLFAGENR